MPDPAIQYVAPAEGESFTTGPIQIRVLEDGRRTDNRLGAVVITVPPHTDQTPLHLHHMHDETFLVLAGTVRFTTGPTQLDVPAGGYVVVPVGAPHSFSNPFGEPAVFYNSFTPAYYVQYLRDLSAAARTSPLTPERILAVMARYATEEPGHPLT